MPRPPDGSWGLTFVIQKVLNHGIQKFHRGRVLRIIYRVPCLADVIADFHRVILYFFVEQDVIAKFIGLFYIFVGYAAGASNRNK